MHTPKRAAIYARFSTELQRDRSIEDQVALCRQHATHEGLTVAAVFSDRARSGASIFGRPGLAALMDAARAREFDVVIVEALDRLSRDQEDLAALWKRLSFAGIELRAVHDGVADAVQIGVRGMLGSLYLADLAHKVRRGLSGVVRDGRHAGGRAYGYRPTPGQPGRLQIDPDEAATVRRIFDEYVAGRTPRDIAHDLNRDGIRPPRGASWNASAINGSAQRGHGIIRNPVYAGRIVWNRVKMVRDPETGRRVSRVNPESEWQSAEAPHLAIVAADVFERAQARKRRTVGKPMERRRKHFLSGLLKCGQCGAGMSVHDRHHGRVRIRCSRERESGSCGNAKRFYLDRIQETVLGGLAGELAHPEVIAEVAREYHAETLRLRRASRSQASTLAARVRETKAAIDALLEALAARASSIGTIGPKLDALEAKLRDEEAALAAAQEDAGENVIALHPAALARYRKAVRELSKTLETLGQGEASAAFSELVEAVVVDPDGTVSVTGRLSALLGRPVFPEGRMRGVSVVAEVRYLSHPPFVLMFPPRVRSA